MATVNYTAGLSYYDGSWNSGETAQGCYGNYRRTGVMCFSGMNLKGMTINSIKLTLASKAAGKNAVKTAYFYRSKYQKVNTSVSGAEHRSGNSIGSLKATFYNNTLTLDAGFLKSAIASGENTFCIYISDALTDSYSTNYLKWSAVTITVDYSDPTSSTVTAPTSITPAYGTLTYYDTKFPTVWWSGATNVSKYIIERATSSDHHLDTWYVLGSLTATTYREALDLPYGSYVRYRVKAVGADGTQSGYIYTGNIRRMLPNTPPENVVATVENDTLTLTWDGETADFAVYNIQYHDGEGWNNLTTTPSTSISIAVSDVPTSGNVTFRVNLIQNSVDSDSVIESAHTESNTVTIEGGIWVMANGAYKRGTVFVRTGGVYVKANKIKVKINGEWRSSK